MILKSDLIHSIHFEMYFDGALLKSVSRFGITGLILPKCEMYSEFSNLIISIMSSIIPCEVRR